MKNIKFLFLLVATLLATAFTACEQDWEAGQPDSELSVYFPVDVNVAPFAKRDDKLTSHDERFQAAFPVYRQNGGDEMNVEIRARFLDPNALVRVTIPAASDKEQAKQYNIPVGMLFSFEDSVTFAQGETKAYFYVNLNTELEDSTGNVLTIKSDYLTVGTMYDAEILVKDPKHCGNYGLYRKTLSVGIPETWKVLGTQYKDDLKFGTFTEDFFTTLYGGAPGNRVTVTIEESEARANVYRLKNLFSQDNVVKMLGGVPGDMNFATGDTYIVVDASKSDEVYIPWQYAGFGIQGYMEQVYIASGKSIGAANAKLENGKIVFPAMTVGILDASGSGRYTNESGLMAITLPGISVKDYSLQMSYVGTETTADNSETRAYFDYYVGEDVSKYRFVVVEGNEAAYSTVEAEDSTITNPKYDTVQHPAITAMLEATYDGNGDPVLSNVTDETIKEYLTNAAEVGSSFTNWYITLPKSAIYTMFAVAYDENGAPVKDEEGNEVVARIHFYYHPANENHEGGVPDITGVNLKLASITEILTAGITKPEELAEATEYYENRYPSCFFLGFDIQTDDADYVSQLAWYYTKTADLPKGVDPYTLEGQKTLITKHAGEDSDLSYQIGYLKDGGSPMVIAASPDTEYTVVLSMTSIYGKTSYYTVKARTTPYSFNIAFGTYTFVDGESNVDEESKMPIESKMTLEIEPFYNASEYQKTGNGELFYIKWIVEDEGPYTAIREYPFIGFNMPEYNAIVTYGQVNGFAGSFFGYDMPWNNFEKDENGKITYTKNPNKVWGFESSSKGDYEKYNYESMVLKYNEDGLITRLDTFFRQYVKTTTVTTEPDKKDPEKTVEVTKTTTKYDNVFAPDATVVECIDNKKPVLSDSESQPEAKRASFSYGAGRISKQPAKKMVIKNLSYEAVSIL